MNGAGSVAFSAPAREGDYFRAELLGLPQMPLPLRLLYGYMIAVTNPVYVGAVEFDKIKIRIYT